MLTSWVCAWIHERSEPEVDDDKYGEEPLEDGNGDGILNEEVRAAATQTHIEVRLKPTT